MQSATSSLTEFINTLTQGACCRVGRGRAFPCCGRWLARARVGAFVSCNLRARVGACWRVICFNLRARVGAPVCGGGCSGLGLWLVGSGRWFVGGGRRARGAAWERILVVVVVLGDVAVSWSAASPKSLHLGARSTPGSKQTTSTDHALFVRQHPVARQIQHGLDAFHRQRPEAVPLPVSAVRRTHSQHRQQGRRSR